MSGKASKNVIAKGSKEKINGKTLERIMPSPGLHYISGEVGSDGITVYARTSGGESRCPECGKRSRSHHSTYVRTLKCPPISYKEVTLHVTVHRYRCGNRKCVRKIFCERLEGTAEAYSRRLDIVSRAYREYLTGQTSRVGSELSGLIGGHVSQSTCLRIAGRQPLEVTESEAGMVRILGIDEFAYRRGQRYGTVIVDIERHRVMETIYSRTDGAVVDALKKYSNVLVVSRDRSSSYGKAISEALPHAVQVADRFHLVKNLSDKTKEAVASLRGEIFAELVAAYGMRNREPVPELPEYVPLGQFINRRSAEHIAVLHRKGIPDRKISREYHYSFGVIRRVLWNDRYISRLPEIAGCMREGKTLRETYETVMGCSQNGEKEKDMVECLETIFPGIKARDKAVAEQREEECRRRRAFIGIAGNRKLHIYVSNPEYGIDKDTGECTMDYAEIIDAIHASPTLTSLRAICSSFKEALHSFSPHLMDRWIENAERSGIKAMVSFAAGLKNDIGAVRNTILYEHVSNGIVEGFNNKIKAIKRNMFGRASPRLLAIKIIYSS